MIKAFLKWVTTRQGRTIGEDMAFMTALLDKDFSAFMKFSFAVPATQYRKTLSKEVWHGARIAAARVEDCGPCVQTTVNQALLDGLSPEFTATILNHQTDAGSDLDLAVHYAEALLTDGADLPSLIDQAEQRFGRPGLMELALTVTMTRNFPVLKRAMGYAVACSLQPPLATGTADAAAMKEAA